MVFEIYKPLTVDSQALSFFHSSYPTLEIVKLFIGEPTD